MSSLTFGIYENVIKKDEYELKYMSFEKIVHESLEGSWSICEPKRHDDKFIMAFMGLKCCFGNIFFLDADLMITERRSNLEKNLALCNSSNNLLMTGIGNLYFTMI